jgi:hypothetical protein
MTLEEGIKERLLKRIDELPDTPETELLLDKSSESSKALSTQLSLSSIADPFLL